MDRVFHRFKFQERLIDVQCDQIWRNSTTLAKIKSLWQLFNGLFSIWHYFYHTLPDFQCHWANFHCYLWLNIEQIIFQSGHTNRYVFKDMVGDLCVQSIDSLCYSLTDDPKIDILYLNTFLHIFFLLKWIQSPWARTY